MLVHGLPFLTANKAGGWCKAMGQGKGMCEAGGSCDKPRLGEQRLEKGWVRVKGSVLGEDFKSKLAKGFLHGQKVFF